MATAVSRACSASGQRPAATRTSAWTVRQAPSSGAVSSAKANEPVFILAEAYGSSAQQVATLLTGANGTFSYTAAPTVLTNYSAKWKAASSQTLTVQVRPKLALTRTTATRLYAKLAGSRSFAGRSFGHYPEAPMSTTS